jgi:outer membrane receptor for ferrienterochelin and colicins
LGDYALFASAELRPLPWLTLRPGLRYAYNTAYNAPVTPSLNLRASRGNSTLRLSYAQGFRAPSLKELYFYFVDINHNIVGNPGLKAERSQHLSGNLNWRKLGRELALWELEAGGFYNDLDNLITLAEVRSPEFTYVNIGRFRSLGGTLRASWRWQRWQASAGASYTGRAQQLGEGDALSPFAFYPELNGNFSYALPRSQTRLSLFFKYQGRLPGFRVSAAGQIEEQYVEAYSIADLTLIQPLARKRLTATLGAKNLMNVTNVGALLSGGAHSAGGSSLPVATGRTFFAKLDLHLGQLP